MSETAGGTVNLRSTRFKSALFASEHFAEILEEQAFMRRRRVEVAGLIAMKQQRKKALLQLIQPRIKAKKFTISS